MRDMKRWAWALGITLVLSALWMIAGGALVYNYFPPEPGEKVIVWDTQLNRERRSLSGIHRQGT